MLNIHNNNNGTSENAWEPEDVWKPEDFTQKEGINSSKKHVESKSSNQNGVDSSDSQSKSKGFTQSEVDFPDNHSEADFSTNELGYQFTDLKAHSYLDLASKTSKPSWIDRVLWRCSGANIKVLEKCQIDQGKYAGIGLTILLTALLASLSGGYALWTVFNSKTMAVGFGLFWGLMIGNLDRFLVSTTRTEENWSTKQYIVLGIRITVAVSIAFVVAKPLELKIFEKPIRAELVEQNSKTAAENRTRLIQSYTDIPKLEQENQKLQKALNEWKQQRDEDYRVVIGEAEGTSGTNKLGKGPVYDKKWQKYQQSLAEYQSNKQKLDPQINDNLKRITEFTQKRDNELANIVNERKKADDIMTQLETLHELGKKKPIYAWSSFFITLIFVLIDVAPILAKFLLKRSLYDQVLEQEEKHQLDAAKSMLAIEARFMNLENSKILDEIEVQENTQEKAVYHFSLLQNDLSEKAFDKASVSPEHQKSIDELAHIYTSKSIKAVNRIGKEYNPYVHSHEIREQMDEKMKNDHLTHIVNEEAKAKKQEHKIQKEFKNTKKTMRDFLTNFSNNGLPNNLK